MCRALPIATFDDQRVGHGSYSTIHFNLDLYSSFGRVLARELHEGFDFDSLLVRTWLVEG